MRRGHNVPYYLERRDPEFKAKMASDKLDTAACYDSNFGNDELAEGHACLGIGDTANRRHADAR
jgi:hypothetical protein